MSFGKKIFPRIKIPAYIPYILCLFVLTRLALEAVGYAARTMIWHRPVITLTDFLSIWSVWDSSWYLEIATTGYSTAVNYLGEANYAFFPLYPMLIRLASVNGDYLLSGLLVSNICLLIACVYLYKFVALDSPDGTALRSIKYLFLFPTAFLFSAVLSESLFLALAIACLYYARKGKWPLAGVLGFFIALSRPPGVIIVLPLLYEYFRQSGFKIKPDALLLLLPPIGLSLYAAYNWHLTGDPLGFVHIMATWGGQPTLPFTEIINRINHQNKWILFGALYTCGAIGLMIAFARKVDFGAWLLGVLLIMIPLFTTQSGFSMLRYITVVFPLFIIFAKLGEDRRADAIMTIVFAITQVIFMAHWTTYSPLIV